MGFSQNLLFYVDNILKFMYTDNAPNRECNRIVFFCSRRNAERDYKEEGLNAMRELDDFIIYEKGELAKVIKDFIENN